MEREPVNPFLDIAAWRARTEARVAEFFSTHQRPQPPAADGTVGAALAQLVHHNATLWGYEDEVRREDIPDSEIARYKRLIDRENQLRNDAIDRTDQCLAAEIEARGAHHPEAPLNTETPGSAFDRLSILLLRRYHLQQEVERRDATDEHIRRCAGKRAEIEERIEDLCASLDALIDDILGGRRRMKSYATHKLYNDPETNPAVRRARQAGR
jgi:hypothetical protein